MKTRKFLLAVSVLAVAGTWTGCNKNEQIVLNQDAQAISFHVQGGVPGAQQRVNSQTQEYVNAFIVYAEDSTASAKVSDLFDGQTVARTAETLGAGKFDYSPHRFYSQNAVAAGFHAYSPVSPHISGGNFAGFHYTVPAPAANGNASQEDLLYAVTNVNPLPLASQGQTSAPVQFNFKHALSRIFVSASNNLSQPVIVKSLRLLNLNSEGDFDYTADPAATPAVWNTVGTKIDYQYALAATGVAVPAGTANRLLTSMEQGIVIVPQTAGSAAGVSQTAPAAGVFALEVKYDVSNQINQTRYITLAANTAFQIGKQYAIHINFEGAEINFSISVDNWSNDSHLLVP